MKNWPGGFNEEDMAKSVLSIPLPLIPVRKEASDKSEMVTQFLFGERVEVCDDTPKWLRLRSLEDGYTGWADRRMLTGAGRVDAAAGMGPVSRVYTPFAYLESEEDSCYLPMGSILRNYDPEEKVIRAGGKKYTVVSGLIKSFPGTASPEDFLSLADLLLNAPYLWGGRSCMGIDCSGLVQLIGGLCGVMLPRDACDQAACGTSVTETDEAKIGDLVFFKNAEGRVIHVGICRENHTLIHASGEVRVDRWDSTGIFRADIGEYTHRLHSIKRIFPRTDSAIRGNEMRHSDKNPTGDSSVL